jgi:hypothetical protein
LTEFRKIVRTSVKRLRLSDTDRRHRNAQIVERVQVTAPSLGKLNFVCLRDDDVRVLFESYDDLYFDGLLSRATADVPLEFRVSSRMTRAGGKTSSWRKSRRGPIERFEIAISSTLLLQTFETGDIDRAIHVTGLECHNRLEALMRVMEHELVHLSELLGWGDSSCRQDRFQMIAWQTFGHTNHQHALITPGERAAAQGIRPGSSVTFRFEGRLLTGIVNRVTRRATVLVPDATGERFSDGNVYRKYYVPLDSLHLISAEG